MNRDERVDKPFLKNFMGAPLWIILAIIVIAAAGLFVLTPWSDDQSDNPSIPAAETPPAAGTPNPNPPSEG